MSTPIQIEYYFLNCLIYLDFSNYLKSICLQCTITCTYQLAAAFFLYPHDVFVYIC